MKKILFCLALLFFLETGAQSYSSQRNTVLLVNVLSNAIIGGIGGAINKDKNEKVYKAFARNFLKGGAGGLVKYSAKSQVYYLGQKINTPFIPLNRLYFFLGHSMVMNSAHNKKILDTYYCNFYGIDLRFSAKEEQKIKARLSFATLVSTTYMGLKGFELDPYRSLEYGQLMFSMKPGQLGVYNGMAMFNTIVLNSYPVFGPDMNVFPHELVHTYQAYDYFAISSFYDQKLGKKIKENKYFSFIDKYVVLDYQVLFFAATYAPQFRRMPHYYKNYFEFEAEHFQTRLPIVR